jgi:hypothetical protein
MNIHIRQLLCLISVLFFTSLTAQNIENKVSSTLSQKEHSYAFKFNLVSPFYGTLNLSWQKVISNDASFQLTASYTDFDSYGSSQDESQQNYNGNSTTIVNGDTTTYVSVYNTVKSQRTQGFAITPEYRYLLNGRKLSGVYVAPFMRYMYYEYSRQLDQSLQITTTTTTPGPSYYYNTTYQTKAGSDLYAYHTLGLGVTVGKQIMFKNKVLLDFFLGPSYSLLLASNKTINSTSDVVIGSGIPNLYIRGYGVRAGISIGLAY